MAASVNSRTKLDADFSDALSGVDAPSPSQFSASVAQRRSSPTATSALLVSLSNTGLSNSSDKKTSVEDVPSVLIDLL